MIGDALFCKRVVVNFFKSFVFVLRDYDAWTEQRFLVCKFFVT